VQLRPFFIFEQPIRGGAASVKLVVHQQTQQQTGMPFIIMQQVQPGIIMALMQSQQAWIIFMQLGSPLVQVIMQPISIISILHMPIMPMLQLQTGMPFIMQPIETMPPCIIMQRFFIISAEVLSAQVMVHFMPPGHFSIFMVQRGIIIPVIPLMPEVPGIMPFIIPPPIGIFIPIMGIPIIPGIIPGIMPIEPIAGIPIIPRSVLIVLLM
jgi:hypothetical protein